ncbi:ABC transporter ATP-binding protein [Psychrobium sp. 1_MG-2023]|nr:ABC transporter ATP-binding protein [Psychrobium sp. 1_MG-2023]MDP2560730.1 ABC transporter ATP-binding protein [Psychrobium sp. 1_MG-2023]PKF56622.1 ABC transporter [Alteromonadales bacterium alter-6D02]
MTQLTINNLACDYNDQSVISELSLALDKNEILALLGPSGCGKTTLLRSIAGLQAVSAGEIYLGDKLVSSSKVMLPSEHRNVGMIFQDYALFPHLTVEKNIAFGLGKLSKQEQQQRISSMLSLVKLTDFAQRYPHQLSGGQQQRVAIARALAYQPDLMLLDEPFSNIDSQSRGEIMIEIRQILKQQQVPAVFVTHSKDEAFAFADKLAIFNQGKIEQIGTAQTLYQNPASPYVANFMGKANYIKINGVNGERVMTRLGDIVIDDKTMREHHCTVMLRPEQLKLSHQQGGDFKVEHCFFSGSHWVYRVRDEKDTALALEVHSNEEFVVGQSLDVGVEEHALVTFNMAG